MVNVDHVVQIKMEPNKILPMLAGKLVKSETDSGQIVTGTQANRSVKNTGK